MNLNEIGRCSVSLNEPICYDEYRRNVDLTEAGMRRAEELLGCGDLIAAENIATFTEWVRAEFPDVLVLTCLSISQLAVGITEYDEDRYVEKTKKYLERYEQAMRGNSAAFASRLDRGWVPPTLEDLETEEEAGKREGS